MGAVWLKHKEGHEYSTVFLGQQVTGLVCIFPCGGCLCKLTAKWRILSL